MGQQPSKESSDEEINGNYKRMREHVYQTGADSNAHDQGRNQEGSCHKPKKDASLTPPAVPRLLGAIHRSGLLASTSPTTTDDGHLLSEPPFKIQQALYELDTSNIPNVKRNSFISSPFSAYRATKRNVAQKPQSSSRTIVNLRQGQTVRPSQFKRTPRCQKGILRSSGPTSHPSPRFEGGTSGSSSSSSSISINGKKDERKRRVGLGKLERVTEKRWWKQTRILPAIAKGRKLTKNILTVNLMSVLPTSDVEGAKPSTKEGKKHVVSKSASQKGFSSRRWAAHLPRIGATTNVGPGGKNRYQRRLRNKMFTEWVGPRRPSFFGRKTVAPSHQHFLHPPTFYYSDSSSWTFRPTPSAAQPPSWRTVEPSCISGQKQDSKAVKKKPVDPKQVHSKSPSTTLTAKGTLQTEDKLSGEPEEWLDRSPNSSLVDERLPSFVCLTAHSSAGHVKLARTPHRAHTVNLVTPSEGKHKEFGEKRLEFLNGDSEPEINFGSPWKGIRGWVPINKSLRRSNHMYWTLKGDPNRIPKQERMAAGKEVFGAAGSAKALQHKQTQGPTTGASCSERNQQASLNTNAHTPAVTVNNSYEKTGAAGYLTSDIDWCSEAHMRQGVERTSCITTDTEMNSTAEERQSDRTLDLETDDSSTICGSELEERLRPWEIGYDKENMKGSECQESRFPQRTWLMPTLNTKVKMNTVPVVPLLPICDFQNGKYEITERSDSPKCYDSEAEQSQKKGASISCDLVTARVNSWVENQRWLEAQKITKDAKSQTDDHNECARSVHKVMECSKEDYYQSFGILNTAICTSGARQLAGTEPTINLTFSQNNFYHSEKDDVGMPLTTAVHMFPRLEMTSSSSQSFSATSNESSVMASFLQAGQDKSLNTQKDKPKNPLAKTLEVLKSAFHAATKWGELVTRGCHVQNYVSDSLSSSSTSVCSEETTEEKSEATSSCELGSSVSAASTKCGSCCTIPVSHLPLQAVHPKLKYGQSETCKSIVHHNNQIPEIIPLMFAKNLFPPAPWSKDHRGAPLVCPHVACLEGQSMLIKQSIAAVQKRYDACPESVSSTPVSFIKRHEQCAAAEPNAAKPHELPRTVRSCLPDKHDDDGETKDNETEENTAPLHTPEGIPVEMCETICTPASFEIETVCPQPTKSTQDIEVVEAPCECHTQCTCWVSHAARTCGNHLIAESVSPERWRVHERPYKARFRSKRLEKRYNAGVRTMQNVSPEKTIVKQPAVRHIPDNTFVAAMRRMALDWLVQRQRNRYKKGIEDELKSQAESLNTHPFQRPLSARIVLEHFFMQPQTPHVYTDPPKKSRVITKTWYKKRPFGHTSSLCSKQNNPKDGRKPMCLQLPAITFANFKQTLHQAKARAYLTQCRKEPKVGFNKHKSTDKGGSFLVTGKMDNPEANSQIFKDNIQEKEAEFALASHVRLPDSSEESKNVEHKETDENDDLAKEQLRGLTDIQEEPSSSYWDAVRQHVKKKETVVVHAKQTPKTAESRQTCPCNSSIIQNQSSATASVCICRHQFCTPKPLSTQPTRKRRVVIVSKHPPNKKKTHNQRVTLVTPLPPATCHQPTSRIEAAETNPQKLRESIEAGGERSIGVHVRHLTPRSSASAWKEGVGVEELLNIHPDPQPATSNAQQCRLVEKRQFEKCKFDSTAKSDLPESLDNNKTKRRNEQGEATALPFSHAACSMAEGRICNVITPLSKKVKGKAVVVTCSSQSANARSCSAENGVPSLVKTGKINPRYEKILPVELLSTSEALRKRQRCFCHQREKEVKKEALKCRAMQIPTPLSLPIPTPTPTPTPTPCLSLPSLCAWSLSSEGPPQQSVPDKPSWARAKDNSSPEDTEGACDSM